MCTGKYVLCLKACGFKYTTNHKITVLITNSVRTCVIYYLCVGTTSRGLLRWKIEMHMTFEIDYTGYGTDFFHVTEHIVHAAVTEY